MSIAATSSSSAPTLSGLASGMDWNSIINELVTIEKAPETQMQAQQTALKTENTSYQTIGTNLAALQNDMTTLKDPNFFDDRTAAAGNASVASATAAAGTALGSYTFKISQLASEATWQGATAAANPLSATDDVSGVELDNAGFANPVTAGTFTVNGHKITIAATDTLQSVFGQINTATGGAVTAAYSASADEITLSSSSPVVLGNATDTSNFLQVAELYNNGGDLITSASALGGINLGDPLGSSHLSTPVSDGGGGAGQFLINGEAIDFNAATDSINSVLRKINDSAAGVTATYDAVNNQFQLTNKTTGDVGISLEDVTGNFLAATGLAAGALQRGDNLHYSVNGGGTLASQSNSINSTNSGITGLSVTALGLGTTAISVQSDTSKISDALNSFVTDYNAAQNYIKSQTASSTDSTGTVTPGALTGDMDAEGIATQLRRLANASPSGLSGEVQNLNDLGITSNGSDNTLLVNSILLPVALEFHLDDIKKLFTDPTSGLATTLSSYLGATTAGNGVLATKEASYTKESNSITASIAALQQRIALDETRLQSEFTNMETAINSINTQRQYLTAFFNSASVSNAAPTAAKSSTG